MLIHHYVSSFEARPIKVFKRLGVEWGLSNQRKKESRGWEREREKEKSVKSSALRAHIWRGNGKEKVIKIHREFKLNGKYSHFNIKCSNISTALSLWHPTFLHRIFIFYTFGWAIPSHWHISHAHTWWFDEAYVLKRLFTWPTSSAWVSRLRGDGIVSGGGSGGLCEVQAPFGVFSDHIDANAIATVTMWKKRAFTYHSNSHKIIVFVFSFPKHSGCFFHSLSLNDTFLSA